VILAAVVATWYVPAYLVNGKLFVNKFLIEQNVGRFSGGDAAHTLGIQSLPFFLPVLLLGMLPWSAWIWSAWPRRSDSDDLQQAALRRYLATWAAVVFIFFSLSGAKLVHYILPALPPLAILIGHHLAERKWAARLGMAMCGAMCVIANYGFLTWYRVSGQEEAHDLVRYLRRQPGDVAFYQLGRRQRDRGTGKPKLQETSLPSLFLYLNRDALDTDDLSQILAHKGPIWLFTRTGRIQPEDFIAALRAGRHLDQIEPTVTTEDFALYRVQ